MDPAILSATAALVGSLVGGVSTFAAYWLTQRVQLRAQALMKRHAEREALYAEFIVEASKRLADAWSHHAESPDVVAVLFSAIERMRVYIGFLDVPLTKISALEDAQIGQSAESRCSATELHRPNLQWPIAVGRCRQGARFWRSPQGYAAGHRHPHRRSDD